MYTFLCYDKCSTCKKAENWLTGRRMGFQKRSIKENKPTVKELKKLKELSGLPLKKFFNTSGKLYRELNLKDKLKDMTEDEMYKLLASDGMLVKRPIIFDENVILVGFKEEEWEEKLKTNK